LQSLGDLLARPGAVYLFALPAMILVSLLDPETGWGTTALGGWSLFIYPCFFVSGFVIASNEGLQASIQRWRWVSLAAGILSWPAVDILWAALGDPTFGTWRFSLGSALFCLSAWCWLLTVLGFGMKHLSFNTRFLKYANEAALPFYILHLTVIVSLVFFVVRWAIPDWLKFVFILTASFLGSMGVYEFLVRRVNLLRFLFGMKRLPGAAGAPAAEPQIQEATRTA
jgi:glucan biosynthesis protein C